MPEIQDQSYFETKLADDTKVSISAKADLRDYYNALRAMEEIFHIDYTGVTKSRVVSDAIEALASLAYEQGLLDEEEDLPETTERAARLLHIKYGITFGSNNQQLEQINEAKERESEALDLRSKAEEERLHGRVEEKRQERQKEEIEKRKEELKAQAFKGMDLQAAANADVEETFNLVEEVLPSPFPSLVQVGQKERFSNQEIANQLRPLVERQKDEGREDVTMEIFHVVKDWFEDEEPDEPVNHFG